MFRPLTPVDSSLTVDPLPLALFKLGLFNRRLMLTRPQMHDHTE